MCNSTAVAMNFDTGFEGVPSPIFFSHPSPPLPPSPPPSITSLSLGREVRKGGREGGEKGREGRKEEREEERKRERWLLSIRFTDGD